jgi:glutamate carboxypeptidase
VNSEFNDIINHIATQQNTMLSLLYDWCHINSGSYNLEGLSRMNDVIVQNFTPIADIIESHPPPPLETISMSGETITQQTGNILILKKRPELKQRLLLCGHMDTVFPVDHCFQTIREIDENTLNGPGVADMKGGLIVILQALMAFEQTSLKHNIGWDVIINADEEIGSCSSFSMLEKFSHSHALGLVYEPSMSPTGTLAKNRRGSGKFTLIARGCAAHVGREFEQGRNAICFLADILCQIHQLNGLKDGVTVNVGKIQGGDALNMVPDVSVAKLDVRITSEDDKSWFFSKINTILTTMNQHSGYSCQLIGEFSRPIKKVNEATTLLFKKIQDVAMQLNLSINWQDSGGCCDGNNLAQHGMAVIDTLGVRGGKIHSNDEYLLIDSLVERTQLSTLLLMHLSLNRLEDFTR